MKLVAPLSLLTFIGLFLVLIFSQKASAIGVGLGGSLTANQRIAQTTTSSFTSDSYLTYGGGLVVGQPLSKGSLLLETGLLYSVRKVGFGVDLTQEFQALNLPFMLKIKIIPMLSFGLGAYLSHGFGKVATSSNKAEKKLGFEGSGIEPLDYGLQLALGTNLTLTSSISLFGDLRFSYGINDIITSTTAEGYQRALVLMVGLRVGDRL